MICNLIKERSNDITDWVVDFLNLSFSVSLPLVKLLDGMETQSWRLLWTQRIPGPGHVYVFPVYICAVEAAPRAQV